MKRNSRFELPSWLVIDIAEKGRGTKIRARVKGAMPEDANGHHFIVMYILFESAKHLARIEADN